MSYVYVTTEVQVDLDEVLDHVDEYQLRETGYTKIKRGEWEKVAQAMRDNDMPEVCRLVSEIAYDQTGMTMPPLRVPAAPAKVA